MSYHWRGRRQIEAIALLRIAKRSAESVIPDFATLPNKKRRHRPTDALGLACARRVRFPMGREPPQGAGILIGHPLRGLALLGGYAGFFYFPDRYKDACGNEEYFKRVRGKK